MDIKRTELTKDEREILSVELVSGTKFSRLTGHRIEAYDEHGEMAWVPWIAIKDYRGEVTHRFPARLAIISY